jgi:hypothetical protein
VSTRRNNQIGYGAATVLIKPHPILWPSQSRSSSGTGLSMLRDTGTWLKVYRLSSAVLAGSIVLLPIPYTDPLRAIMVLGGTFGSLLGLCFFLWASPSGVGLGQRFGIMVTLCAAGLLLFRDGLLWGAGGTPLQVMGVLCFGGASVVFQLFWMKVAEAHNAWRLAERFRDPMVLGAISSVISIIFLIAEVPMSFRSLVSGGLGLLSYVFLWMALSELQRVLDHGAHEDDE